MAEFLNTYGLWIMWAVFIVLMMRMHGGHGMRHGQQTDEVTGDPTATEQNGRHGDAAAPGHQPALAGQAGPTGAVARRGLPSPWAWLVWLALWVVVVNVIMRPAQQPEPAPVDLTQLAAEIRAGEVQRITVDGNTLLVKRADGGEQHAHKEPLVSVPELLRNLGVEQEALGKVAIEVKQPSPWDNWLPLVASLLPMALFIGFLLWMSRKGEHGLGQIMSFAKSRARPVAESTPPGHLR